MTDLLRLTGKLFMTLAAVVPLVLASMLPLSALVLAIPAVAPQENPLGQSTPRNCSWTRTIGRRLFALLTSITLLIALAAVVNQVLTWLPLAERTFYGKLASEFLPAWLVKWAPPCLVQHWPSALILIYMIDLLLLVAMGSVPMKYNLRNLRVRWKNSLLVTVAFALVVALLVVMLSLVNAMYRLMERSGHPANVIVMSEGATDELFSNLGGGDVSNGQYEVVTLDDRDRPLQTPVVVQHFDRDGEKVRLYSRETYLVASQPIPGGPTNAPGWRFVQIRGVADPDVAGLVHGMHLRDGGRWFAGVATVEGELGQIEAVIGEGIARQFGADVGRSALVEGDTFELAGRTWRVTGVLRSEGSTFNSEIWADALYVRRLFHKDVWTTVVYRVFPESAENARHSAYHVRTRYKDKVHAQPETDYYAELSENNRQLLFAILFVASVAALGGVFGLMNTMFAAIASRAADLAVLRVLGFRRWQIAVSLLLESVGLAFAGGLLGCGAALFADGLPVMSMVSSGGVSGKTVMLNLAVEPTVLMTGLLFALTLGRLGGLIPALSFLHQSVFKLFQ
jgi:ABC-type lipoprotein release transport system permease subunit